ARPASLAAAPTPGKTTAVQAFGPYAFLSAGEDGIEVWDLGDPTDPALVTQFDTPGTASGIGVVGNDLYVAGGASGIQLVDITNPAHPQIRERGSLPGEVQALALDGEFVYAVGDGTGFEVVRVLRPVAPQVRGHYEIPGRLWQVAVDADLAYLTSEENGLQIVDVSVPEAPTLVGQLETPGNACGIAVAGDYAYVGSQAWHGTGVWTGLNVVDVSDPASPRIVSALPIPFSVTNITLDGDLAYLVAEAVYIVDIADPERPEILNVIYDTSGPTAVERQGRFLYVASSYPSLQIVDIQDPRSPVTLGSTRMVGFRPADMIVSGDFAYLCGSNNIGRVHVVDVRDPSAPVETGHVFTGIGTSGISSAGSRVYVADVSYDVVELDVSNPYDPVAEWLEYSKWMAVSIAVDGEYAFVLGRQTSHWRGEIPKSGLRTYRIADRFATDLAAPGLASAQAIPNPFRGWTKVEFELPSSGTTRVSVHDVSGREVRTLHEGQADAGRHDVYWNGLDSEGHAVPAGMYWIRVSGQGANASGQVVRIE
ncbi:MAG: T9SS type A sorting domain-containing protein, partial [Candidatus Eisenbacteria bacterium]|nr:T9SS type A sorting domain-containing protein [Candidatus Eisenbacteria bacterium]